MSGRGYPLNIVELPYEWESLPAKYSRAAMSGRAYPLNVVEPPYEWESLSATQLLSTCLLISNDSPH